MAKKRNTKRNRAAKKSLKQKFEEHPITVIATAIVCFLGVPAAIIGLFMQIRECAVEFSPPEPSIVMNEVGSEYSSLADSNQPLFIYKDNTVIRTLPEQKDYIIGNWYLDSNYLIQNALITNRNQSNDITLTKFSIHADNIEIDYAPDLEATADYCGENTIEIKLFNNGWSDVSNINISITDEKNMLDLSNYHKHIEHLKFGTHTETFIQLDMSELDYLTSYGDNQYKIYLEIEFEESDNIFVYSTMCYVYVEGTKVYMMGGGGYGPSRNALGICIDTDYPSYEFSRSIQEVITAGEVLEVPIFFFPDKSCEFDYYIEFEVSNAGRKQKIKTDSQHVKYKVDSSVDVGYLDASKLTELKGWRDEVGMVSYPYSKEWTWYEDELYGSNDSFNYQGNVY